MRSIRLVSIVLFLVVGVLAAPVGAVPGLGSISATLVDITGAPFPHDHLISLDAFDASLNRYAVFAPGDTAGGFLQIDDVPDGIVRVRMRVFDGDQIIRYEWVGQATPRRYADAADIGVTSEKVTELGTYELGPFKGAPFMGTVTEGKAIVSECVNVVAYEENGIAAGVFMPPAADGTYTYSPLPAGNYLALARTLDGDFTATGGADCDPRTHLDQWFDGLGGEGFYSYTKPAEMRTTTPLTVGIIPTTGIDFELVPVPLCAGMVPTIYGTTGDDTITGTAGADVIATFAGDDEIDALGGRDRVCAGSGDDELVGGPQNDKLFGEGGADEIFGGSGNDAINAGFGADTVNGNAGRDSIKGGTGNDDLRGGTGDDTLRGNGGDDEIRGKSGNDRLIGGLGTDEAHGGGGTDTCNAETEVSCEI